MRFNYSLIHTWMQCSLMARFQEIDRLPRLSGSKQVFGSIVHHALDQYNRTGDLDHAIRCFTDGWDDPSQLGLQIDVWNRYTAAGSLRERGIKILRDYDEKQRFEPRQVIASEHRFCVPFGRHELSGIVDLAELKNNHKGVQLLRLIDYKTSSKAPLRSELYANIQFSTYAYASLQPEFWLGNPAAETGDRKYPPIAQGEWWHEMLQETPRRAIWYHLWDSKELDAGERGETDFMRLYRVCNEIERAIEAQVFVPNISGDTCGICDYADGPCPVRIPTREEVLEDDHAWL